MEGGETEMLGLIWFLLWQFYGQLVASRFLGSLSSFERLVLGSICGSLSAIWVPIPFSFLCGFTPLSHLWAAAFGIFTGFLLLKRNPVRNHFELRSVYRDHRGFIYLSVPFIALFAILLVSHTLREIHGGLYTGQSGWGDMPMHLGFITSIAVQGTFPPEYSILPGERLCYPFLCDSVSSSLYLLGMPLRWAYILPALFAFAQAFFGFYLLARSVVRKLSSALLATVFFFLNGGLGMIYFTGEYTLKQLLTGFYKTPTNLSDHGIRWVNVMADMLLPQRATLLGWSVLFAILLLLYLAVFRGMNNLFLPAGILGGLLPMVHTHSYLSLGLVAGCWLIFTAVRDRLGRQWLISWLAFGIPAVLIAVPQLFLWTFHSVNGNEQFLRFHFDWVNGGQENWLWFWLKNIGPMFLIIPIAFVFSEKELRAFSFPALFIFVLCEFVAFQPNIYDNNKLLYISYAIFCISASEFVIQTIGKIRFSAVRYLTTAILIVLCTHAALFTLAREYYSGTECGAIKLFSASDAAAAEFILENTSSDALFLTASNHNNSVAALTGRNVFCGSPSYLFYHGLDYSARLSLEDRLFTNPVCFEESHRDLGIDYVYLGDYEKGIPGCCAMYFDEIYPAVFREGNVTIYKIN